jgi:uncharacterized membrane protein
MRTQEEYLESQKRVLWLTYILYILLFPALLGFIINMVMLSRYRRLSVNNDPVMTDLVNMFWGHHLWLFRTFIITVCFAMAAAGTMYYAVGYVLGVGVIIWWFYRILRGVTALFAFHPAPVWR